MTKIGVYLKDVLREMNELPIGDSGDSTAEKSSNCVVDTASCSDRDEISDLDLDDDDDFTDSASDSEMSDEDEVSSGADPSDDSDSDEQTPTPKKVCTSCYFPLVLIAVMSHPIYSVHSLNCRLM